MRSAWSGEWTWGRLSSPRSDAGAVPFLGRLRVLFSFCVLPGIVAAASAQDARVGSVEPEVRGLIQKLGFELREVGVAILGPGGEPLAELGADRPFKPASNQKVLTTAAALHFLGPDHKYTTSIGATAPMREGTISGDLIVRGTGDPNISSRFYEGGPSTLFRSWASELRRRGLTRVTGGLLADDTYFDAVRLPPSWDTRQAETWYSAQISPLSLNDNCLDVIVRPASAAGRPARVEIVPAAPIIKIQGAAETVASGKTRIILHRKPGTNEITLKGQVALGGPPWTGNVTIDDPAQVFVTTLAAALRAEGITIEGKVGRVGQPPPRPTDVLVEHTSGLLQDLGIILKRSQNLHAELLFKTLGARVGGEGSAAGGELALRKYVESLGLSADGLVAVDGSGLSHQNRVSAAMLARVLHAVRREAYFKSYLEALPVGGKDGTLDDRFRNRAARGQVYAKTGYIRGVSCLSGYVARGDRIASFSILVNRAGGGIGKAKALQEEIVDLIYRRLGGAATP